MQTEVLLAGATIGFSIAAPVGPIGLLCIQSTLNRGRWIGLATGLGAALADAAYGLVAALGFSVTAKSCLWLAPFLKLGGAAFLIWLGFTSWQAASATRPSLDANTKGSGLRACLTTFALTLSNPMTMVSFLAVMSAAGIKPGGDAAWLVAGVFMGSIAWWFLLTTAVSSIRGLSQPGALVWINRAAGAIIVACGLYLGLSW